MHAQVLRHHRTACHAVVVARKGTVKKTSSGKVKRRDCAIAFMSGQYTEVSSHESWCVLQDVTQDDSS